MIVSGPHSPGGLFLSARGMFCSAPVFAYFFGVFVAAGFFVSAFLVLLQAPFDLHAINCPPFI